MGQKIPTPHFILIFDGGSASARSLLNANRDSKSKVGKLFETITA
jgi:hypothetical protein